MGTETTSPTQKALPVPGQVKFTQKISAEAGGLSPNLLEIIDLFGSSAASLGDLDGDDVTDIAIGARGDDDGSSDAGAVYVLFLNSNGTVGSSVKISRSQGNFTGYLEAFDRFGTSVASVGDLDGDGIGDPAVGADGDNDGRAGRSSSIRKLVEADRRVGRHDANAVDAVSDVVDGGVVYAKRFWHRLRPWFSEE